ncbi:DUF4135 domain-containing protein [Oceanitalea stevensii]|uniref:DUF4135 domain-containing protein n=1 Tax=Oceanitalea stevensii TaxID=2763072 RepID=A0ABR8Z5K7_9MICO|nr:DUF4135 domain-containing protein [Oceanitalea stevensii]MBD8063588.1 DUF4135 domain-containing protein [Oceanitalea stevensii]
MDTTSTTAVDASVELALHAVDGRFPTFHRAHLHEVARALDGVLGDAVAPRVRTELLTDLVLRLDALAVRTLITLFQSRRRHDPALDYATFDATLPAARAELRTELPELDRLLHLTATRWLDHVTWVLAAAGADRARLAGRWGTGGRLTAVRLGQGDTHCGGRSVAILEWSTGPRLVLKPTVSRVHPALAELVRLLDDDGSLLGPVLPDTLAGHGHEWQRFVAPGTFTDTSAARYLRRYGRLSALLHAVGATDIHRENVVATPEGPVVVDTETLCSLPTFERRGSAHEALARSVEAGVLRTMMYPSRFLGARMPLDLSALGVPSAAAGHYEGTTVTDAGTDDIRFDTAHLPLEEVHNRLCTDGGEQIDPRRYAPELLEGYAEGIALLRRHRGALQAVLDRHDLGFRQVFRATWRYARLLESSTHPSRLADRDRRLTTLRLLTPTARGVPPHVQVAVRDAEVEALADGDIPYFEVTATGALHANGSPVPLARLDRSPAQMMTAWWDHVLDEPLADQLRTLRLALDAAADDAWQAGPDRGVREDLTVPAPPPAPTLSEDGLSATWLSSVQVGDGLYLTPVSTSLYEGGGVLCALWETRAPARTVATRELLRGVVAGATFHPVPADPDGVHEIVYSPFTGALADVVVDAELAGRGVLAPDRAKDELARTALQLPALLDELGRRYTGELLGGAGGAFTALNRFRDLWWEDGADLPPTWPAAAENALARVMGRLDSLLDAPEAGLAHGNVGRLLGLAEAVDLVAGLTGRERDGWRALVAARLGRVLDNLPAEEAFRDPRARQSWCRGVSGLAPALVRVHALSGAEPTTAHEARLEALLDVLVADPPAGSRDLSLCHGAAGHVLALTTLGRHLDRPELLDRARARRDRLLEETEGPGWTSGLGRGPAAEGFFVGRAGWDLASAALADPGVRVPRLVDGLT